MGQTSHKRAVFCGNCNIRFCKRERIDFAAADPKVNALQDTLPKTLRKKFKNQASMAETIAQSITTLLDDPEDTESDLTTLGQSIVELNQIVSTMATFYNNIQHSNITSPQHQLFFDRNNQLNLMQFNAQLSQDYTFGAP